MANMKFLLPFPLAGDDDGRRRHLPRAHGRAAGPTKILVELALGKDQQQSLANGARCLATVAEKHRSLEILERAGPGAPARLHPTILHSAAVVSSGTIAGPWQRRPRCGRACWRGTSR